MSRYVIGADAANSIVRRTVFPENQSRMSFRPALEYLVEVERELDTSEVEMFFDNEKYVDGYAWVFPKPRNTANIGVGGKNVKMPDFDDFLQGTVKAKHGNYRLLTNKSGVVPIAESAVTLFRNNAFLTGDAAGLADPFLKGGINQGMLAAKTASECVLSNQGHDYQARLEAAGVLNTAMHKASRVFYSFSNEVFNGLGEVLEGRGTSYLKTFSGMRALLLRPYLRKNLRGLVVFFRAWWKNRDRSW